METNEIFALPQDLKGDSPLQTSVEGQIDRFMADRNSRDDRVLGSAGVNTRAAENVASVAQTINEPVRQITRERDG